MNKKLLTIAIALVVLAIVFSPAAAVLPAKSPLPSGNPWNTVWGFLQDLQNQITANFANLQGQITALKNRISSLETSDSTQNSKIAALEAAPEVHFGEWQEVTFDKTGSFYTSDPVVTDGFVSVSCWDKDLANVWGAVGTSTSSLVIIDSDKSNADSDSSSYGNLASIVIPVPKGNIYRIFWREDNSCDMGLTIRWLPLGSGGSIL